MGTNYYLYEKPPCECCGREFEPLHIGKSSGGWCFALHVIPELGINDLPDWEVMWGKPEAIIQDEYDKIIPIDEMLHIITQRQSDHPHPDNAWLRSNCAEMGPNNLVRLRIDNRHCIGHGDGTWDLIVGEFS